MENANPLSTLGSFSQEPRVTTHATFTARINNLIHMRQTIDSLLFKTMNELTNQSSDFEIFCPEDRIKELELRTQRRNNFLDELFKDRFPTDKELSYHKYELIDCYVNIIHEYWNGMVTPTQIMPPRMRTRSAGRPAAESLGGGTGIRVGRGGRGRRPREGNDERVDDLNGQGNDQEPLTLHASSGCSYKECLACNFKEYDGKGGAVVSSRGSRIGEINKAKDLIQKAVQISGAANR
ncbi:hypothetical protein Tco_1448625 [Tanacetum coccineum]